MSLSIAQIYNAARAAGFTPTQAATATAIALAESGGNPAAHCDNCFPGVSEDSRGLWQINVAAHPDLASWNLYDPTTNARAAFRVSSGGRNFVPWSTYTSGAYRSHVGAVAGVVGGNPVDTVAGATVPKDTGAGLNINPLDGFGIPGMIGSAIGKDVAKLVITGTILVGGVALVVLGMYQGVRPAVQKVQQIAGDAAKAAAV